MHRVSYERRQALPRELLDQSLFESLRLEPYYVFKAERVPAAAPYLLALVEQTRARHDTLVHGDFSPKNILVHDGRLILLDHEVAHVGDPAFDLGFALAHLLSKAHYCSDRRDEFGEAAVQFWTVYRATLGDVPWQQGFDEREVAHTLACLLARVDGRSPLEYLEETHRLRQRRVVLSLMAAPPHNIAKLVSAFTQGLESP
jgi:fructosamine-3-kinase